jgi:hypothetical protein
MKLLWIISVGFDTTDQLRSDFLHSSDTGECNGSTRKQYEEWRDFEILWPGFSGTDLDLGPGVD